MKQEPFRRLCAKTALRIGLLRASRGATSGSPCQPRCHAMPSAMRPPSAMITAEIAVSFPHIEIDVSGFSRSRWAVLASEFENPRVFANNADNSIILSRQIRRTFVNLAQPRFIVPNIATFGSTGCKCHEIRVIGPEQADGWFVCLFSAQLSGVIRRLQYDRHLVVQCDPGVGVSE
jgi:hypothetical protein